MKMNRKNLVNSLEKVYPVVGVNVLVPEFQCFQFKGKIVQAYDGIMRIHTELPEDTEFECGVPGAPILSLLRSLAEEEVELVQSESSILVKAGGLKGSFTIQKSIDVRDIEIPQLVYDDKSKIEDIVEGLNFCRLAVSKDETAGPICGVMINKDTLLSTDRYRIACWSLGSSFDGLVCILPLKLISIMIKNRHEISAIGYDKESNSFVVLLEDGTRIASSTYEGEYRDVLQYFPATGSPFVEIKFISGLGDVLERHTIFLANVNPIDKEIVLEVCKNKCTVISKNAELGELVEELEITENLNSNFTFNVNPVFLKDVSGVCSSIKYFPDTGLTLVEKGSLRYLLQTKSGEEEE
jgi:hypothetical protein